MGIAFLASLNSFRLGFPFHLKIFSLLLGCDFLVEVSCNFLVRPLHFHSNVPLYNIFMIVEFWTYGWFFSRLLDSPVLKKFIGYYLVLLPIYWVIVVFVVFGIGNWNSYMSITGSLFTVCMAAAFYYQLFTAPSLIRLTGSTEFWIATALIVFYACNLPYLGMLNFITVKYRPLAQQLLLVLQFLNIIMYSLFTIGFLCRIRTMKLSSY